MKKIISYILCIIFGSMIGSYLMYLMINKYPLHADDNIQKVQKSVTVTDTGISEGIQNVYDAVVVVENYQRNRLAGIGSGFIYSNDGYIMTNHHVVSGSSELKVVLMSGDTVEAKLIGSDEYADIAVIQIDKKYVTKIANIGSSEETKVGDTVFTIGSPVSADYSGTVTRGILSGKNRMVEVSINSYSADWIMNVMQTDAAINPGNSGGPLCNINGEVIGINSMKIVQNEVEGIGFAIPIEDALDYANKIVSGGSIKRSYLGISMLDISTSPFYLRQYGIDIDSSITSGVIVAELDNDGPSAKAGIKVGDVIVSIGENEVSSVAELRYYLYKHNPKEVVSVKVIRGVNEKVLNVTLAESTK